MDDDVVVVEWTSSFRIQRRLADTYRCGRVLLAGCASDGLLDTYEAERLPIAKDVLESTSGLTEIVVGDSGFARFVRDRVGVPLLKLGLVQRFIGEKASQLQVSYRNGPLGAGR